jgi:hypothetical protein
VCDHLQERVGVRGVRLNEPLNGHELWDLLVKRAHGPLHEVTGGLPLGTDAVGAQPHATVHSAHTIPVINEGKVVEQGYVSYVKMLHLERLTSTPTWLQRLILEEPPTQTRAAATHPPLPIFLFHLLPFLFNLF